MNATGPHLTKYGTFEIRYREGNKHRSKSFKTKTEARRFKDEVNQRLAAGKGIVREQDVPFLEDFAIEWMAGRTDLAESTQEKYAEFLATHVLPDLGHLRLTDLRPRRLAEWQKDRLAAEAGPAVLGKAQTLLGQILNEAVLPHEYLDVNPVSALKKPKHKKKEHRWLTAFEVEQIRMKFIDWEDLGSATLVSVLAYVGIRPEDVLALEWEDFRDGRLSVTKKNVNGKIESGSKTGEGYRRTVYVPPMVLADLREWGEGQKTGLIFPRAKDGQPWTKSNFDNWRARRQYRKKPNGKKELRKGRCFKLAAEESGLGWNLVPYSLRHTGATLYIASGWNHVKVAHQLGHSPEVSMRTYQHLYDSASHAAEHRDVDDYIREARGMAPRSTDKENQADAKSVEHG